MNSKQKGGVVIMIIGVVLFIYAMYAQGRIGQAKEDVSKASSLFSGNPIGDTVGDVLQGEASQYDTLVMLCEVGGIVLFVLGAGIIFYYRKK